MNKFIPLLLLFVGMLFARISNAQGSIQSVVPSKGIQGQNLQIVIKGLSTNFQNGGVSIDFGEGIEVIGIDIRNSITIYAEIIIHGASIPGMRDLIIVSNGETIELFNAFEVIDLGINEVFAILEINPVQVVYASDFDPDNLGTAPVLFRISVLNDQQIRSLKTYFYLILEGEGLILTAIKDHGEVQPSTIINFDNREFDEFEINEENAGIASQIVSSGILPPGQYTYQIEVKQGNNTIASTSAQNTLLNQSGDIIILSPGSPIDDGTEPDIQLTAQPIFQWISSANQFDLFLYEVADGQINTQQITQNLPVYRAFNITGNSLLYPISSEPLEEGTIYAWQIRAYFNNPTGNGYFDSPLYWFRYNPNVYDNLPIGSIEIVPNYLELETGQSYAFDVIIKDLEGNDINIDPVWNVFPDESFGTISKDGVFTAGINPRHGAVQVSFETHTAHCIVKLEFSGFSFDLLGIIFNNSTKEVVSPER